MSANDPQSSPPPQIPIRRLPTDQFKEYLYAPPLEVPQDYSSQAAFTKGVETGDWLDYQVAARKVCRLIIEAAQKNESVRRWLLTTNRFGDEAWNKMMMAVGRETSEIARQINRLQMSADAMIWCVFSAVIIVRELPP
ncbi:MAG: hypothetical protein MUP30_07480 [Deltaproteobacteria bacterium]|nr:hypothetical protein [Deltaproteobacteria bacterium]